MKKTKTKKEVEHHLKLLCHEFGTADKCFFCIKRLQPQLQAHS